MQHARYVVMERGLHEVGKYVGGLKKFSASTIDGNTIGKIFFS
jgi:hypothetical protein